MIDECPLPRVKRTFSDSNSGVSGLMSAFLQSGRFYPGETPIFRVRFRPIADIETVVKIVGHSIETWFT